MAKDAKTVLLSDREDAVIHLLRCWLTQFLRHHAWRLETTGNNTVLQYYYNCFYFQSLFQDFALKVTEFIAEDEIDSTSESATFLAVACEMASR